eukprot:scaffold89637_cov37-Prasinocladus_malaysianus.AAC.1
MELAVSSGEDFNAASDVSGRISQADIQRVLALNYKLNKVAYLFRLVQVAHKHANSSRLRHYQLSE